MDIRPQGPSASPTPSAVDSNVPAVQTKTAAPVQIVDPVQEPTPAPTAQQVKDAVKNINEAMRAQAQGVEFSVDAESEKMVVKVIDQETKEVLRQMPSEEALAIAKALDRAQGLLIRQKA